MASDEMRRFIEEAAKKNCEPEEGQTQAEGKKLITKLYELLNNKDFDEDGIKEFFKHNQYCIDFEHDIRGLKALHTTADALYDCSSNLRY